MTTITEVLTVPDHLLAILESEYTLDDQWYAEANAIAEVLNGNSDASPVCKLKPWDSAAVYLLFNKDDGFHKWISTLPIRLNAALSAVIGVAIYRLEEEKPEKGNPGKLLEEATQTTDAVRRARILNNFLTSLIDLDELEADAWLEKAKEKVHIGKTALKRRLVALKRRANAIPGQKQLHDRWLQHNPYTVRTLFWRRYQDGHWPTIPDDTITREVKKVIEEAEKEGVELTGYLVRQVTDLVTIERYVHPNRWDSEPNLFVCQNGTVNLETLKLRDHSPDDWITMGAPYDYDPNADCPTFRYVMGCTMAHAADFLQEFAGYALTSDTSLETAIWLCGNPGGGKSTFLEGLKVMLGDRCGTLGIANIERSRFGLAGIIGKTLLIAFDQPDTYITAADMLNSLISGECLPVERKFHDVVDITPRAKICWSMNRLPTIAGGGNSGVFRRVRVVNVEDIPEDQRDPQVKELVKTEAPGILNWALEGLQRLNKRGKFDPPQAVTEATREFQRTNDKQALFMDEKMVMGAQYDIMASELYEAYREWCLINGYRPEGSNNLKQEWTRLGLIYDKRKSGRYYVGATLKVRVP